MRRAVLTLHGALALAIAATAPVSALDPLPGRYAVVVGVESYAGAVGRAPGAIADARHVAGALEAEGYAVELIEDADEAALKRSVYTLVNALGGAGDGAIGVFYFVGQAVQVNGDTFLLPIDSRTVDDLTLTASALSGEHVSEQLGAVAGATSLIVVDAASPNALTARFGLTPGVAALDTPGAGLVMFSHYPDEVALPRQEGVSVFARAFAGLVHDRQRDFDDTLQSMRAAVSEESGGARYAWISGDLDKRFTLSAPRRAERPAPATDGSRGPVAPSPMPSASPSPAHASAPEDDAEDGP